jgi:hypothetical protein
VPCSSSSHWHPVNANPMAHLHGDLGPGNVEWEKAVGYKQRPRSKSKGQGRAAAKKHTDRNQASGWQQARTRKRAPAAVPKCE